MAGTLIKSVMHVATLKDGYGIRIRLTRIHQGVWMGQSWGGPADAKLAYEAGATVTPEGWLWPTAEAAETHMNALANDAHSFGYEEVK